MGTTRFLFIQGFTGSVLINGNAPYLNEPARTEDPALQMQNAWDRDRYVVWATGAAPPNPLHLDIDLGADAPVTDFLVLNRRSFAGGAGLTQFKLQYRTAAAGYDGAGVFTDAHTGVNMTGTQRNAIAPAFSITGRYLRVRFITAGPFIAKIWGAANSIVDLGAIASPGLIETIVDPRTEVMTPEAAKHVFRHGTRYRRFALPFESVPPTMHAQLRQAILENQSFLLVTHEDEVYEVIVSAETAEALTSARDAASELRDLTLFLDEQP